MIPLENLHFCIADFGEIELITGMIAAQTPLSMTVRSRVAQDVVGRRRSQHDVVAIRVRLGILVVGNGGHAKSTIGRRRLEMTSGHGHGAGGGRRWCIIQFACATVQREFALVERRG